MSSEKKTGGYGVWEDVSSGTDGESDSSEYEIFQRQVRAALLDPNPKRKVI